MRTALALWLSALAPAVLSVDLADYVLPDVGSRTGTLLVGS